MQEISTDFISGSGCKVFIAATFDIIPVNDWNVCLQSDDQFLSSGYLRALEKSNLPGLSYYYILIYESGLPIAALYFQSSNLSDDELGGVLNLESYGMLAGSITSGINTFLFNPGKDKRSLLLVCGNLFVSGDHGIRAVSDAAFETALKLIPELFRYISSATEPGTKMVAWMVKDFETGRDEVVKTLLTPLFFRLNTDPAMVMNINQEWKSFPDYLSALSSKYRVRANASLSRMEELQVRDIGIDEMAKRETEITSLLNQVIAKAPVKLARLSATYFIELKLHFGNQYDFRGLFLGDQMVAFTSGIWNPIRYEAHYIGLDYSLNKQYGLYQNILYCYIEDAIRRKVTSLSFGRTALEIKSTVGAKPVALGCYLRLNNKIYNSLARPLIGGTGTQAWIPRDPFRRN
ncbi:MAG TPA: GNAT family N-acetyltransferase [Bacteroidia bacterium]|nr:GNAT family N-acetyltransferase [Bacteroidia bacterium]